LIKHIDTAPVIEAFAKNCECPVCELYGKTEEGYLESFLGGSVMEPDVRVEVNRKGFCAKHFLMLYGMGNRLGVALMAHTHLKETIEDIRKPTPKPKRWGRGAGDLHAPSCACCDKLNNTMERYLDTVIYLYETDSSFKSLLKNGKGLCVPHYRELMSRAVSNGKNAFAEDLRGIELANLEKLEKDLEWFTLKFDYRNADKPWGESRDALIRALAKVSGAKEV
jgi:hypothetical protein